MHALEQKVFYCFKFCNIIYSRCLASRCSKSKILQHHRQWCHLHRKLLFPASLMAVI
jgi:hypothetical protein